MKGSYEIRVHNRTMAYHFTVYRNITILQGFNSTSVIDDLSISGEVLFHLQACR